MKGQIVPGLTPQCISQVYDPAVAVSADSSVVLDLKESTAGDGAVPMSNLELLGNVAYAMAQSDGIEDCAGQPVALSTNADGLSLAENDGQPTGSRVLYIVRAGDGDVDRRYTAVLPETVELMAAADDENARDNDCAPSISGAADMQSLYFTALPDNYDTLCAVEPIQFSVSDAVSSTNECSDNAVGDCTEDQLVGCEHSTASENIVSTATDSAFFNTVDMALDSFSLSVLTNTVT